MLPMSCARPCIIGSVIATGFVSIDTEREIGDVCVWPKTTPAGGAVSVTHLTGAKGSR